MYRELESETCVADPDHLRIFRASEFLHLPVQALIGFLPQSLFKFGSPSESSTPPTSKLSLRLLPALIVDNDEDDDGNFTNWMSSYWGHGGRDERAKERKRSFRKSRNSTGDRRASLPCMSQLEAMHLKHPLTPIKLKSHDKGKELRSHPHARRVSSDEYRGNRTGGAESGISTVPDLTESFRRMLRLRRVSSVTDADKAYLICHEELRRRGVEAGKGGQELHCSHHFHKEDQEIHIHDLL
ncbi:leukemia NUP98 fusion partner 1 [Silurus asotus]|uniref:Leukemia NUP98 fusion partner 1 n=1 Tax=Silurus asotus TaxID=30991 RepID=A0AAD5AMU9_SILAS|nr:leukemia NUP98 fusion partner 1 [Silurus asotus]